MQQLTDLVASERVYLLHGLMGTAYAHFGAQIARWTGRYQVTAIDLPGHGRCTHDAAGAYSDEAFRYVDTVVAHHGAGHLVATSYLGGPLGARLARERPELVRSLTLTGFVPGLPEQVFGEWCEAFENLVKAAPDLAVEFTRLHGERWRATLGAFLADARAGFSSRILVTDQDLRSLPSPVLVVNGSWKELERVAAERASTLGEHGVTGVVISGAGHVPAQDAPDTFDRVVTSFWADGETCRTA